MSDNFELNGTGLDKHFVVHNGRSTGESSVRRIVMNTEGMLRPVISVRMSGSKSDRGSRQAAYLGDIIIEVTNPPEQWRVLEVDRVETATRGFRLKADIIEDGAFLYQYLIRKIPKDILAWLSSVKSEVVVIPPFIGWDGINTVNNGLKISRIKAFFTYLDFGNREKRKLLGKILEASKLSSFQYLPISWERYAQPLDDGMVMDNHYVRHLVTDRPDVGENMDIHQEDVWILFHKSSDLEVIKPKPTYGYREIHTAQTDLREDYASEPIKIPTSVYKAIKISFGGVVRNGVSGCVKWELYKR